LEAGRTIAAVRNVPIVGVNHLEGHLASTWLVPENRKGWKFPILFLLVSGGHSELILMRDFTKYKVLGRTRDDAAGEAFDKTGKLMGLGYPGGPALAKLALNGDPTSFDLPRPMLNDPSLDMSFSGLKTAVLREWQNLPESKRKEKVADLSASIQIGDRGRSCEEDDSRRPRSPSRLRSRLWVASRQISICNKRCRRRLRESCRAFGCSRRLMDFTPTTRP
jgi:N6-L-threonylcarbamoyladenine synthase